MQSHLLHMLVYATLVSAFFALLVRRTRREQLRLGLTLWLAMVGGALLLAYVMYPFPR
jgi:ABC-type uncharacterized transport system permease subunit